MYSIIQLYARCVVRSLCTSICIMLSPIGGNVKVGKVIYFLFIFSIKKGASAWHGRSYSLKAVSMAFRATN